MLKQCVCVCVCKHINYQLTSADLWQTSDNQQCVIWWVTRQWHDWRLLVVFMSVLSNISSSLLSTNLCLFLGRCQSRPAWYTFVGRRSCRTWTTWDATREPAAALPTTYVVSHPPAPHVHHTNKTITTCNLISDQFNHSIKINLYSAMCHKRIRGTYWRSLDRLFTFTICNIEQFRF